MRITIVNEKNKEYFVPLMPEHIWKESDLVFGAVYEDTACGILAVTESGDTMLSISYLFVAEEFRRKGIAAALLAELHKQAAYVGMDATVCQYVQNSDTEALTQCFSSGLFEEDELKSPVYAIAFGELPEKLLSREKPAEYVLPLSQVTGIMWNGFLEHLENMSNEQGTVPDLKDKSAYDQDAGFFLMSEGEVKGCILFEKQEKDYILSYFCILGQVSPVKMMALFQESYRVLKKSCTADTKIYVNTLTETTQKMILQITEGKAQMIGEAVTLYYTY